ncbi:MAG: hypothetical protein A6D91_08955 [Bacillaceae bacterium G1]|nr:MAG: hypothetical protein A6D91_08955 [Bacillaceae bacterium G1]
MKEIVIGDGKVLRLKGSPLSLLYYRQEFGSDLLGDLVGMVTAIAGAQALQTGEIDPSKLNLNALDSVAILRLIWTLAKTAEGPSKQFPSFETWLAQTEELNIFNGSLLQAIFEEVQRAFFRGGTSMAPKVQKR